MQTGAAGTVNEGSDMELGGKFWLAFIGVAIACVVAGVTLFLLVGGAWHRWGFLGMFLGLSAVTLAIGWFVDRREKKLRLAR
jgi:membrane protein implicated in regulation of membrane protease activity